MSDNNNKKEPKPEVTEAFKAIEELSSELSKERLDALRKTLPHLAAKMAYSSEDVTKSLLLEHAQQGDDHIANLIKKYSKPQKAKPLKYKDVIGNLKYPQTRLDQNLDQAIKNEDIDDVKKWLKLGARPETLSHHANPWNAAVRSENIEIIGLLIDYTDFSKMKKNRCYDLVFTTKHPNQKTSALLEAMLDLKCPFDSNIFSNRDIFTHLCDESNLDLIKKFIDHGALTNPDLDEAQYCYATSPIITALRHNNIKVAQLLLDNGADISAIYSERLIRTLHDFNNDALKFIIDADPALASQNAGAILGPFINNQNFDKCDFLIEECGLSIDHLDTDQKADYLNTKAWKKFNLDPSDFINKNRLKHRPISQAAYEKIVRNIEKYVQENNHRKRSKWLHIGVNKAGQHFDTRCSWQDHEFHVKRELDYLIERSPLRQLYQYSPYHVDMDTVLAICDMLEEEGYYKQDNSLSYAYHAAAVFKTEQRVLEYLQKWGEVGKQPLHNIIHDINVPKSGRPDLKAWGDALMKHGPKMAKYVKFSDRLVQPIKDGSGSWSYTRTKDEIAKYSFKRGIENPALAKHCLEISWNDHLFDMALEQVDKFKKKYSPSDLPEAANDNIKGGAIPDITIKGSEFNKDGYTFRKLPDGDVRGLLLGAFTNCCQHLGSRDGCTRNGFLSETAGFYVVEDNKSGDIVAQSWAWRGQDGELTFDSWESLSGHFNKKTFTDLCKKFSEKVQEVAADLGITAFTVGTGGETPRMDIERAENPAKPLDNKYLNKDRNDYESDSRNQYLIAEYN